MEFTITRMPSPNEPTALELGEFVVTKMPESGDVFDAARDVTYGFSQGFNEGLDSIVNAPYNLMRAGAGALGYDMAPARNLISEAVNTNQHLDSTAGRMARTAGEVTGASVPFVAAPMGLAMRPAAAVAPSAKIATPAIAPQTTTQAVGHEIMQGIRSNPVGAAQMEAASAAGAGLATATAREAGAGPVGEMIAGVAGGFAPALGPAARSLVRPDAIQAPRSTPGGGPVDQGAAEGFPAGPGGGQAKQPPVASSATQQEAIRAYHGSPHEFDRFDASKIGTGEGDEVIARGLYFSGSKEFGDEYFGSLSQRQMTLNGEPMIDGSVEQQLAQAKLDGTLDDMEYGIRSARDAVKATPVPGKAEAEAMFSTPEKLAARRQNLLDEHEANLRTIAEIRKGNVSKTGALYDVDLNVTPDELIVWEKPLSAHPAKVQQALRSLGVTDGKLTGAEAHEALAARLGGSEQAANALKGKGVQGVSYSASIDPARPAPLGVRDPNANADVRNYVIFDDQRVKINSRNGKPVASGGRPANVAPTATPGRIVTPDGSMEINAAPVLIELDELKLAGGKFQPRDRSRDEYVQEARERASRLDPSRLGPERVSDSGAPIIMEDGTIISGNGRALSISEIYRNPNLAAQREAYRASLGPEAANMRQPVRVMRSQLAGEEAERFAAASNTPRAARMSATERARVDAKALGDDFKLYQGGEFDAPQNIDFMRAFIAKAVPAAERASISKDGRLTKEGIDRMRSAVLASAFDDADTLSRLLESADDNVRGLTGAMADAAPVLAALRADITGGHVLPGLDPTGNIQDAVKLIASLRARGVTPQQHFAQVDAFNSVPQGVESWVRALYADDLGNQLSRAQITAMLRAYADEAGKHAPGGLFPDLTTGGDVLRVARNAVKQQSGDAIPAQAGPTMPDGRTLPPPEGQLAPPSAPSGGGKVELPPETGPNRAKRAELPSYLSRSFEAKSLPTRDELIAASERTKVPVSKAAASDSDFTRRIAAGVSDTVMAGSPLRRAAAQTLDAIQRETEKILHAFGSGDKHVAGKAVSLAMREWIAGGSKEVTEKLYKQVAKSFDKKVMSPVAKLKAVADDLARDIAESTSEVNQKALDLIEGALKKPGGMSYDGLIKLRQDIGARFDGSMIPEPGTPIPALKRIYGALSDDLHGLVFKSGGEEALNRYLRAERVNQLAAQKRKELAEIVGQNRIAPNAPEHVVDSILGMASSKKSGDLSGLLEARKIVGSDAWNELASHAISRMGFTDTGFSAERFFTAYSNLTENGRRVLFGSTGKEDLKRALDDIATIASRANTLERLRNKSGTFTSASAVNFLASGIGFLFHPLTTAAPLLGSYGLARILAKPATAQQVSRWAQARLKLAEAPSRSAHLQYSLVSRALAHAIAKETGEDEDQIAQSLLAAGAE